MSGKKVPGGLEVLYEETVALDVFVGVFVIALDAIVVAFAPNALEPLNHVFQFSLLGAASNRYP